MIRVRNDDILQQSSSKFDPNHRFRRIHRILMKYNALHVPAIMVVPIQQFQPTIKYIKYWAARGKMEPQWHGWEHVDYAEIPQGTIEQQIRDSQEFFMENFGVRFTKFYTPWGANAAHIDAACRNQGVEMVDCSNLVRCVHVQRNPEQFRGKDLEIMIHWWEGINRLKKALILLND